MRMASLFSRRSRCFAAAATALAAFSGTGPQPDGAVPPTSRDRMPVREVTIFKDGHAFVLHSGRMATDGDGNIVLDELPKPILGTFWPFSADDSAELSSVVVGRRDVTVERTALDLRSLIAANVGAEVLISEDSTRYSATIVGVLKVGADEPPAAPGANGPARQAATVLLRTNEGVKAVALDRIRDVTFKDEPETRLGREESRERMTLRLDWGGSKPRAAADIGMMYVQKGIRWIPNYKITLDGDGSALIELQATLVNELTDLDDVTANLVVGVPRFEFEDTPDPIALQKVAARLGQYFQPNSQTAYALSNAIMSQTARMGEARRPAAPAGQPDIDLGPDVGGAKSEDLFVFTVEHVDLKKGERMVMPVTSFTIPYSDVYQLDVPVAPPTEVWRQFNDARKAQIAALFDAPKVMHEVRLQNRSAFPLTTAPALLLRDGRVLAQGMMTYTAVGAQTDLPVTTAVDVRVEKADREVGRDPNALTWRGDRYMRVDLEGRLELTNYGDRAIEIEVVRHVLGEVGDVGSGGEVTAVSLMESVGGAGRGYPTWWTWYSWPWWWQHFNGIGRIEWGVRLEPGEDVGLEYAWHYIWR